MEVHMTRLLAATLLAAAFSASATAALAQGNPFDIRARTDAERAQNNYRDAVTARDAARQAETAARMRNQMLPEPGPVPPVGAPTPSAQNPSLYPDPAHRIQAEETRRLNQWQADQARQNAEAAERAARDARRRVPQR
jgi:hypothetical protein